MKIRGTTICFKSDPSMFKKEQSGIKPNTVRQLTLEEAAPLLLPCDDFKELVDTIQIVESKTGEFFTRELTDITYYDDRFIFSWKHVSSSTIKEGKKMNKGQELYNAATAFCTEQYENIEPKRRCDNCLAYSRLDPCPVLAIIEDGELFLKDEESS